MQKLLTELLNLIFPPRATEKVLQDVSPNEINILYSPGTFESNIYLCSYSKPIVKAAIVENKFHQQQKASDLLSELLNKWTKHQIMPTLYLPVPLGPTRLRLRGYNQVENILDKIAPGLDINNKVLQKKIDTQPQSELSRSDRLSNIQGVFFCNPELCDFTKYKQVVIVDDVVTTGATLEAARTVLVPHLPPHITLRCLAIAH